MIRLLPLVALALLAGPPVLAQNDGAFTVRRLDDGRLNLNLQQADGRSNFGRTFERSEFTDVSVTGDRIRFSLKRAPGSFAFEGRGTSLDRASGWYVFTVNPAYPRDMERVGFRDLDDRALFALALDDLSVEKAKQLQGLLSDTIDSDQLVRLIHHGAGLTYIQAMTDAGFRKLSSDEYRRARDHGVTAQFAKEISEVSGEKHALEELVRIRDHGVSGRFIREMRALGHGDLSIDEYVRMRDHGVTPEFVQAMRDVGFEKASARELVRMRDHGVTAAYVKRLKEQLRETPSVEDVIRFRSRGWVR